MTLIPAHIIIGYTLLENLIDQGLDPARPVYFAQTSRKTSDGEFGLVEETPQIMVAQPDTDDHIHYWLFQIGNWVNMASGVPIDPDRKIRVLRLVKEATGIVRTILSDHGLTIHDALIGLPDHVRLFAGESDLLGYNKSKDAFYLAGVED